MAVVRHDGPDLRRTHEQEGEGYQRKIKLKTWAQVWGKKRVEGASTSACLKGSVLKCCAARGYIMQMVWSQGERRLFSRELIGV